MTSANAAASRQREIHSHKQDSIMSTLLTNYTVAGLAGEPSWSGASLIRSLQRSVVGLVARRAFRAAEAELLALDRRKLKDVGIDLSEIGSLLMEDARGRPNSARRQPGDDHTGRD